MILPSIDLQGGNAVQLVGGKKLAIDAGDPAPIRARFSIAGEIALVDLDAALGRGNNQDIIFQLLREGPARVGGGIRDVQTALRYLDAGATKVVIGTKATPDFLQKLPRDRVCVALDAVDGEVVVDGWRTRTGDSIEERLQRLLPYAGSFLITFVEKEGRLGGTDLGRAQMLVRAAQGAEIVVAGGVTAAHEVAALDQMGASAQIGMSLYSGTLHLADAITAPVAAQLGDAPWPTLVVDERGFALGLVYSSSRSVRAAIDEGRGIYESRKRGLWRKGESSGNVQELLRVEADCDRDALRFTVRQKGNAFCHRGSYTCFGPAQGLSALERLTCARREDAPPESYTARLFQEGGLLQAKLQEEARELAEALAPADVADEAADLLYFTAVKLAASGVRWSEVERVLDRRALRVSRRPGDAKPSARNDVESFGGKS